MCDIITQSSTLPFLEQFANTVVLDSAQRSLGAHWGRWWKRKYLQINTGKKPSGKMHFDVWMQVKELHLFFSDQFASTVFLKSAMGYFLTQWSLWWIRKYPQMKARKKLSQKLLGDMSIHLADLHLCFLEQSINTVFKETEKGYFPSYWCLRW